MGGQLIAMEMGMSVVPVRKIRLHLGMMRGLGMRMVHGMMLVLFTVPFFIRAVLGPGLGGLRITRLAIGSMAWRHSQYFRSLLLKRSPCGPGRRYEVLSIAPTKREDTEIPPFPRST
jgi:hypothetical protein